MKLLKLLTFNTDISFHRNNNILDGLFDYVKNYTKDFYLKDDIFEKALMFYNITENEEEKIMEMMIESKNYIFKRVKNGWKIMEKCKV